MKIGRKRAERQFLCSTPKEILAFVQNKKQDFGLHSEELKTPVPIIITGEEHKHLSLSLRLKVGDQVSLLDRTLNIKYQGFIKFIVKDYTEIQVSTFCYIVKPNTTAIIGITDHKTLDFIVEKLTELGIDNIIFFKADYSTSQSTSKQIKLARIEKIRDASLKQCSSYSDTNIKITLDLLEAISLINDNTIKIALYPPYGESWTSLTHLLGEHKGANKIVFVVGPEGGFSEREMVLLLENNYRIAGLSTNTLRVDTACIVTSGIILQHLNSL